MRRKLAALLCTGALLLAAGCASGDEGDETGAEGNGDGMDVVSIGLIPIVDVAPLYLGIEQGFFADENIEIEEADFAAGGAEIVPGVVGGQWDFGFSNILSMMVASNEDLPVQIVANGNSSTGVEGEDFGSLMVPVDSPVQTADELEGTTVAINTLNAIADVVVRASILKAGGDPEEVNFVALPFPDMPAALENGEVDAAFPVEPFQTIIREQGIGRSIASSWVDAAPDLTVAVYFASTQLAEQDPDLVERFAAAMARSLDYANQHPDEVRAIIPTYSSIDAETAAALTLPAWPPEINRDSAEQLAEQALAAGLLTEPPDLDALLP